MNSHRESEQLSAYLDAQLDETEKAQVEAHLQTCAECRGELDALRATVAEMRALEAPAPDARESIALRAALTRARARGGRVWRWTGAAAGAAASIALIAVFALSNTGGADRAADTASRGGPNALQAETGGGAGGAALESASATYDETTVRTLFAETTVLAKGETSTDSSDERDRKYAVKSDSDVARCERDIFAGAEGTPRALRYVAALWHAGDRDTPAYFMVYEVDGHRQLWVVDRETCATLYFAQE